MTGARRRANTATAPSCYGIALREPRAASPLRGPPAHDPAMVDVGRENGMAGGMPVGTPLRATTEMTDRCRRCGGDRRLILDDGPPICRTCVMAWVWLARAISGGEMIAEPHITTMRHAEHVRPRLGCPLCAPATSRRRLGRLDERSSPF